MTIPKHIYQSWYTKDLHPVIRNNIEKMKKLNPEYLHTIYTDCEIDTFVNEYFPGEIADCYNKLNIIVAKVDFWRYLILYKYGGIYLDIDSSIEIPLKNLISENDEAIITCEKNPGMFVQWALIFKKEHPILKKTIDIVVENIKSNKYPNDIMKMTGPGAFTEGINFIHMENFGIKVRHHLIHKKFDMTFHNISKTFSYRIFSIDYKDYLKWKFDNVEVIYRNRKHWSQEEKERKLLK
jgi:mannosyltransferase OCH1-like enzyme